MCNENRVPIPHNNGEWFGAYGPIYYLTKKIYLFSARYLKLYKTSIGGTINEYYNSAVVLFCLYIFDFCIVCYSSSLNTFALITYNGWSEGKKIVDNITFLPIRQITSIIIRLTKRVWKVRTINLATEYGRYRGTWNPFDWYVLQWICAFVAIPIFIISKVPFHRTSHFNKN